MTQKRDALSVLTSELKSNPEFLRLTIYMRAQAKLIIITMLDETEITYNLPFNMEVYFSLMMHIVIKKRTS